MNKKRLITVIVLNSLNVFLIILGLIFSLTDFTFMGSQGRLTPQQTNLFSLFTVDSNLLLCIFSGIILVYQIMILVKKREDIPYFAYILKFIGTVGTTLTLLTVIFYLSPVLGSNWWMLFTNTNLFYHLVCPVIGIVSFLFFENDFELSLKKCFIGIIPMLIYSSYYIINAYSHLDENGKIKEGYDVYGFASHGIPASIIVSIMMVASTLLIAFLLLLINQKIGHKKN